MSVIKKEGHTKRGDKTKLKKQLKIDNAILKYLYRGVGLSVESILTLYKDHPRKKDVLLGYDGRDNEYWAHISNYFDEWTPELLVLHRNKISFISLSLNKHLKWDYEVLDALKWYISFTFISGKPEILSDKNIINEFKEFLDWDTIRRSEYLGKHLELIEDFPEYLDNPYTIFNEHIDWNDSKSSDIIFNLKNINWDYATATLLATKNKTLINKYKNKFTNNGYELYKSGAYG